MISGGEDARICFWSENPEVRMKRVGEFISSLSPLLDLTRTELRGRNDEKKQGR